MVSDANDVNSHAQAHPLSLPLMTVRVWEIDLVPGKVPGDTQHLPRSVPKYRSRCYSAGVKTEQIQIFTVAARREPPMPEDTQAG